jgi:hypothetical protein
MVTPVKRLGEAAMLQTDSGDTADIESVHFDYIEAGWLFASLP